jgi:hypothetical protein
MTQLSKIIEAQDQLASSTAICPSRDLMFLLRSGLTGILMRARGLFKRAIYIKRCAGLIELRSASKKRPAILVCIAASGFGSPFFLAMIELAANAAI